MKGREIYYYKASGSYDYARVFVYFIPSAGGKMQQIGQGEIRGFTYHKKYYFYIDKKHRLHRQNRKTGRDQTIGGLKVSKVNCTEKGIYVQEYDIVISRSNKIACEDATGSGGEIMSLKNRILAFILCFALVLPSVAVKGETTQEESSKVSFEFVVGRSKYLKFACGTKERLYYRGMNLSHKEVTIQLSTSDTDIIQIVSGKTTNVIASDDNFYNDEFYIQTLRGGIANIIATVGEKTYTLKVYVAPPEIEIANITQTGYQEVTVAWNKTPGCTGYIVKKRYSRNGDWETVATLEGGDQTSLAVSADLNKIYEYLVVGIVGDEEYSLSGDSKYAYGKEFVAVKPKVELQSVQVSAEDQLTVQWKEMKGAISYNVYCSTDENNNYACVYTADSHVTQYTQTVQKGITYYFRVTAVCPEGESDFSKSIGQYIPGEDDETREIKSGKIPQNLDNNFLFQSQGNLYMAYITPRKKLKIYRVSSALKVKECIKTIPLKYDFWGGFYAGPDGRFYVAVGYKNRKESKTKTVIKVIQYSSEWEEMKTANIKGGVRHTFVGIYEPFRAGDCRMDMQGNMLFLHTARQMFIHKDGLRHQSNISFSINTDSMEVDTEKGGAPYTSHSFQQFARFKDNELYTLDHGDGYPRDLYLHAVTNYDAPPYTKLWIDGDQSGTALYNSDDVSILDGIFPFQGKKGDNFTGCTVGSMEIGEHNVLVCGSAQPHDHEVAGVTGFGTKLKYNVFLEVCDRNNGDVKSFRWLTNYDPETTSVKVGVVHMVKLSDSRFAILYTTRKKNQKIKLHYVVVSDTGEEVFSRIYTGFHTRENDEVYCSKMMSENDGLLDYDNIPVLHNGKIVWDTLAVNDAFKIKTKLMVIPAVY